MSDWTSVGQAAGRDVLFSRVFCRRVLDHGCDHVVVTDVPVGRDLPVLAVPGLDAPGARAFVVGARHLTGLSTFSKPSSLKRSALMSRFSKPHRTCSPVIGFLPNFSCAARIASIPSIAVISPRM